MTTLGPVLEEKGFRLHVSFWTELRSTKNTYKQLKKHELWHLLILI